MVFVHLCLHDTVATRTCTLTTCRSLWNIKVISQGSRSHGFLCFGCAWYCGYPWTVLSLKQGLTILFYYHFSCCTNYYINIVTVIVVTSVLKYDKSQPKLEWWLESNFVHSKNKVHNQRAVKMYDNRMLTWLWQYDSWCNERSLQMANPHTDKDSTM